MTIDALTDDGEFEFDAEEMNELIEVPDGPVQIKDDPKTVPPIDGPAPEKVAHNGKAPWEQDDDAIEIVEDDEIEADDDDDEGDEEVTAQAAPAEPDREVEAARVAVAARIETLQQTARAKIEAARAQRNAIAVTARSVQAALQQARERWAWADENGTANQRLEAQEYLEKARQALVQVEQANKQIPTDEQIANYYGGEVRKMQGQYQAWMTQRAPPKIEPDGDNPMAAKWIKSNAWINKPAAAKERAALLQISQQLTQEGLAANSPQHFKELGRRLKLRFPNVQIAGSSSKKPAYGAPVANTRGNARPNSQPATNKVRLNRTDLAMMKTFKLDPNNPAHVREFAAQRRKTLAREAR